jgi:hypothetical protein
MSAGTRPSDNREHFGLFIGMFCSVRLQDPVVPTKKHILLRVSDFSWITFLTSLVGGGTSGWLVVKGLSSHLSDRLIARLKGDLDKEFEAYRDTLEQKRKRVEADLSHRIYVSQTQFETEFNAVKDIFAALGKLRLSFNGLRPAVDWLPTDPQEKLEMLSLRLSSFKEQYNALVGTVQTVYPFVPEDIYLEVDNCIKAVAMEIHLIDGGVADVWSTEWYKDGIKQHQQFSSAYLSAAKLVRERFAQLSIAG